MNREARLYHAMLEMEALGAAIYDRVEALQGEIFDRGGRTADYAAFGHLVVLADMLHQKAAEATDPGPSDEGDGTTNGTTPRHNPRR
jgi:hypothetical protein